MGAAGGGANSGSIGELQDSMEGRLQTTEIAYCQHYLSLRHVPYARFARLVNRENAEVPAMQMLYDDCWDTVPCPWCPCPT